MRITETKVIGVVERKRLFLVEQYVLFSFVSVLQCFLKGNADFLQKFITFDLSFMGLTKDPCSFQFSVEHKDNAFPQIESSERQITQPLQKHKAMEDQNEENISIKSPKKSLKFSDIPWKIYLSRALSAWGDRLWSFGAGVFMVALDPEDLQLVAIYGLVLSVSVIVFGAYIGKWIDQSQRLKAAKIFLAIQNLSTALSCTLLAIYFAKVSSL